MSKKYLGEFEQMVMLTILSLGDEAYGVRVMDELERRVGRATSRGSLYVTLDRLQAKGMLQATLGAATPERGGRRKRFVSVTEAGVAALAQSRRALKELWRGLDHVLDDA